MVRDSILEYVCGEFFDELLIFPKKSSLVADSLGWQVPPIPSSRMPDQTISVHLLTSWKSCLPVSHATPPVAEPVGLPVGVEEFVSKVDSVNIISSLRSSEHLCLAFPRIVCYASDEIRKKFRHDNVEHFVDLMEAMIVNPHFQPSEDSFDLLLATLVMLIADINLNTKNSRQNFVPVLVLLLDSKLGPFHSKTLKLDLVQNVFRPVIEALQASSIESDALAGCLLAVESLK